MIEARGLFLLDHVFEDADVFGIQNLDRARLKFSLSTKQLRQRSCVESGSGDFKK